MKSGKPARGITPERAQQILLQQGTSVSLDQAALILDLMFQWSEMELNSLDREK